MLMAGLRSPLLQNPLDPRPNPPAATTTHQPRLEKLFVGGGRERGPRGGGGKKARVGDEARRPDPPENDSRGQRSLQALAGQEQCGHTIFPLGGWEHAKQAGASEEEEP